jgi:hypothetical protein
MQPAANKTLKLHANMADYPRLKVDELFDDTMAELNV